jgi:hypothetical protein
VSTIFILLVFAYYVVRYDVSMVEKISLTVFVGMVALLPLAWPETRIASAVVQGFFGAYIVLRMHYLRAAEKRGVVWK